MRNLDDDLENPRHRFNGPDQQLPCQRINPRETGSERRCARRAGEESPPSPCAGWGIGDGILLLASGSDFVRVVDTVLEHRILGLARSRWLFEIAVRRPLGAAAARTARTGQPTFAARTGGKEMAFVKSVWRVCVLVSLSGLPLLGMSCATQLRNAALDGVGAAASAVFNSAVNTFLATSGILAG